MESGRDKETQDTSEEQGQGDCGWSILARERGRKREWDREFVIEWGREW